VNFSAMVTGTDLAGHGVPTKEHDFQCETLFDVVRAAGGRSAAVGLAGYTGSALLARYADIDGTTPLGSDDEVADAVVRISQAEAPQFLIAQLGRVDDVFHKYGPSSPEVVPMLRETDARLQRLVTHLKGLDYGVMILADHGQHDIIDDGGENHCFPTPLKGGHGSDSDKDCQVPCTWL
jgi:predicted AlkP superfamily pyrophosphatase or phosphodiesterase